MPGDNNHQSRFAGFPWGDDSDALLASVLVLGSDGGRAALECHRCRLRGLSFDDIEPTFLLAWLRLAEGG